MRELKRLLCHWLLLIRLQLAFTMRSCSTLMVRSICGGLGFSHSHQSFSKMRTKDGFLQGRAKRLLWCHHWSAKQEVEKQSQQRAAARLTQQQAASDWS